MNAESMEWVDRLEAGCERKQEPRMTLSFWPEQPEGYSGHFEPPPGLQTRFPKEGQIHN